MRISVKAVLALGALVAMAIPPVVFTGVALFDGLGVGESRSALVAQYSVLPKLGATLFANTRSRRL